MRICIDPGHGGSSRANRGPTGFVEADGVLDIALQLRSMLLPYYDVTVTRETDKTVELYERAKMTNDWKAGLFISIHTNAGPATAKGAETFHSFKGEWGTIFQAEAKGTAAIVQRELIAATNMIDRGIKTNIVNNPSSPIHGMDYYAVVRRTKCPAILVEAGFHTNPDEEALLKLSWFRKCIAEGIAKGVLKAYPLQKSGESGKFESALQVLIKAGIVSSPDYWLQNAVAGKTVKGESAASLILKTAEKLRG